MSCLFVQFFIALVMRLYWYGMYLGFLFAINYICIYTYIYICIAHIRAILTHTHLLSASWLCKWVAARVLSGVGFYVSGLTRSGWGFGAGIWAHFWTARKHFQNAQTEASNKLENLKARHHPLKQPCRFEISGCNLGVLETNSRKLNLNLDTTPRMRENG